MQVTVTNAGALVPKSDSRLAALVRKHLVVSPVTLNDPFPRKFRVYRETQEWYVVPLHWAREALAPFGVTWRDARRHPAPVDLAFASRLRHDLGQPEAVEAVQRSLEGCGGALLCVPPGSGKTVMALYLAARLRARTLVLVHKDFLKQQWAERVAQYLPGARVTYVQGGTCDTSGDVVIAMIQTLISRRYPASTFQGIALTCVDEVHHIGAEAFSGAMWGLCSRYTLGLSATPDRKDGLSRVVNWFVGPTAWSLKRTGQASTRVKIVRYDCLEFEAPPPVNRRGDVCFTTVVTRLCENAARTAAIAAEVARLANDDRDVLVLTHRRQHTRDLADAIAAAGVASVGTYVGGDKACPDTKVVVATYALTSEGFDLPRLNALVLATPASDVEQSCGRVMRGSTARGAIVVDWVDTWGVCFAQAAKRRALYRRSGFTVLGETSEQPTTGTTAFAFLDDSTP